MEMFSAVLVLQADGGSSTPFGYRLTPLRMTVLGFGYEWFEPGRAKRPVNYFSRNSTQPRVFPKSMFISHFFGPVCPK